MRNQKRIYRDYFDIDPDYFPAVNEAVITRKPEMWKKFYPHETFVKLLKDLASVLDRKKKLSLWVEGAYGTGKSHAILTVKKLLDASAEDAKEYFDRNRLGVDLYNNFQRIKNSGKILTVHRYGSSGIDGDAALILAIQESVEKALADAGIENRGGDSLKESIIRYLSDPYNKESFNVFVTKSYADLFGGDDVDAILEKLRTYRDDPLRVLMDKIFKVARERQIRAFSMSPSDLSQWLTETIRANGLKAIVFFWDEFTEYFYKNAHGLTGFQEICELSETEPFYFVIVTHVSSGLFREGDKDFKKLNDRFVAPHAQITLPENIAFQLMAHAMERKKDPVLEADWKVILRELADLTKEPREIVKKRAQITDEEMLGILPIHPYAALLLKHISSAFDSNQRSMFDFIKNDQGDEIRGFQWFIDNYGPEDENPLLTIDMLWEFFYDKGRDTLASDIRSVLDYYARSSNRNLPEEEKIVLKTVLLLQAISQHVGDAVELFIPNDKNLDFAFKGTELETSGRRIAGRLVKDKILYQKPLGRASGSSSENFMYAAYVNEVEGAELDEFKKKVDGRSTSSLVQETLNDDSTVADAVALSPALKLRYETRFVTLNDFDVEVRKLRSRLESEEGCKIPAVVCFAKNDDESAELARKIREAVAKGVYCKTYHFVFVDATRTPLGLDAYEQYREEMAKSLYQNGKDNAQSRQHAKNARDVLAKWRNRVADGDFVVFSERYPNGERVSNLENLSNALLTIDKDLYPDCLEGAFRALPTMYQASGLKLGVECGAARKTRQQYSSGNANTKLETALGDAWNDPEYWKNQPNAWISRVKRAVDETIQKTCEKESRISIRAIYEVLKARPFGFMPCNLTAFVLGFVLREYVKEYAASPYSWSDGLTSDELDLAKLKDMVDEVIKLQNTPNNRYKDKFIVAMTEEEKAFNELSAFAFDIAPNLCSSFEQTRERVRNRMKELVFPIWTLESILDKEPVRTDRGVLRDLIEGYCGIANNANSGRAKTEVDIALGIGKESLKYPTAKEDLRALLTPENCVAGMQAYVGEFEGGKLVALAKEIDDAGNYISALRHKFDADAANWVWNQETANQKIREVILEYSIVAESNKFLQKTSTFADALGEWFAKCGLIRVAYQAAKSELGAVEPLVEILCQMKKQGTLLDSQKQEFLNRLVAHGEEFNLFYNSQEQLFRKICDYYLDGLSVEEVGELFRSIPSGVFTSDKTDYMNVVEAKTTDYRNTLGAEQLKRLWQEKTGSESPRLWSQAHRIPILCLVPEQEVIEATAAFEATNKLRPDAASVEKAIAYLGRATFYPDMRDPKVLDDRFRARVLEDSAVMLEDLDEVKAYLDKAIDADPYDWWFRLPEVRSKLKQMAESKYVGGGYKKAYETIDRMSAEDCKRYLKDLIKNNMVVGIEIIKGK